MPVTTNEIKMDNCILINWFIRRYNNIKFTAHIKLI
jgi:hypothetical protein